MSTTIHIDGSDGEGGGQVLRTSLALSILTGQPFRIERIRAKRDKPGLMRQHLTAVRAAAAICAANVEGDELGSASLRFAPGTLKPGEHHFATGSAGSVTLVLQTVLPPLLLADDPSSLLLEGGTHNPFAPPVDYLEHAFLPIVNRMGPRVSVTLERSGFYPAGGGRVRVEITPARSLAPIELLERGAVLKRLATARVAALPGEIAQRELAVVAKRLKWSGDELQIRQLPEDQGPGNVVLLDVQCKHARELFTGFGMRRIAAEVVAAAACAEASAWLEADVPVGPHLADQLLIPLALARGGSFVTTAPTPHTTTNADVITRFLGVSFAITERGAGRWHVSVRG